MSYLIQFRKYLNGYYYILFIVLLLNVSCGKKTSNINPPSTLDLPVYDISSLLITESKLKNIQLSPKGYFKTHYCSWSNPNKKSSTAQKAIYGKDHREEFCSVIGDEHLVSYAKATAFITFDHHLQYLDTVEGKKIYKISATSLRNFYKSNNSETLCQNQRFLDDLSFTFCSAFLIKDQTLLTAGHCASEFMNTKLEATRIIFSINKDLTRYQHQDLTKNEFIVDESQIFSISEIPNYSSSIDYAVIKLNESTSNIRPFQIQEEAVNLKNSQLIITGHPMGLTMKLSSGIVMRESAQFIETNLDAFRGNSGSPVINRTTHKVVGLFLKGGEDYAFDNINQCANEVLYSDNGNNLNSTEIALKLSYLFN